MTNKINWWRTDFRNGEYDLIGDSILKERISQGPMVERFEKKISKLLKIPYVVSTTSGSMAMLMALLALNIKIGDEVIVPNRTWISTVHAPHILGIKVKAVDVKKDVPILDESKIEKKITKKTKAIIPVYMGGRYVDFSKIKSIAKKYKLKIIEDAAQGLFAKHKNKFQGTEGDIGCFSLSVAKIVSTGQGGFLVTRNKKIYERLISIRTHGVANVTNVQGKWPMPGFNFRFNDILASIGIKQLETIQNRKSHLIKIYKLYKEGCKSLKKTQIIPVEIESGEIPIYVEALCGRRNKLMNFMNKYNVDIRSFYPNVNKAKYLKVTGKFPNSNLFSNNGLYLPSGPSQPINKIKRVIELLNKFEEIH